ncbi:MAG: hypothetical protein Ta2F_12810 [Termitinemataceae bacterium]|nr:MAG: hypothetical protein Ta2F_12810 [Termitinemataceae bacterium]
MENNGYAVIRCNGCVKYPCVLACKNKAVSQAAGDLIIETAKCSGCADKVKTGVPNCVKSCKYSTDKNIISIANTVKKRENAAYTLSIT